MATLKNGASGKGNPGHQHDGQKDYQHSNQKNPDHVRNDTRDHHYKNHEDALTNDVNFDEEKPKIEMDFEDKDKNQ